MLLDDDTAIRVKTTGPVTAFRMYSGTFSGHFVLTETRAEEKKSGSTVSSGYDGYHVDSHGNG